MSNAWKRYAADFNALTDEQIEEETNTARREMETYEDWIEAVASWEAAGKPRGES